MWGNINKYYPFWLDVVPLLIIILAGVYTYSQYDAIPNLFPTHFDFNGHPDQWREKSIVNCYLLLLIAVATCLLLNIGNYFFLIKSKDPRRFINLPIKKKVQISELTIENIRRICLHMMVCINILIALILCTIQTSSVKVALGKQSGLDYMVYVLLSLLLFVCIYYSAKLISTANNL